ncbi:Ubiquitin conjugation factor E4 [Mucor velutinosus]|uniref:Ubiquitin conjugation factor E4 n=1 Tax=Mucor velutinosus TaxID=708070 RepID=A0AAN7D2Y9_9FUNG|nr:Ubiquitin conjugation factor E4 [Mucor velutinosus]
MAIKVLDKNTIQHLHSGQVIVDIEAIVKELIENSLDAHATSIELVFINNGLESIQVKDDGDGIEENDRLYVAKRHYTSKLATFDDLETLTSYGFRGEALNSICAVADHVIIMTKTKTEAIGKQYDLDKEGAILNEKPINTISKSGTVVTLYKPFYNLPVRRQLAQKNTTQNNKKCQELLIKYALAHPSVRFSLHLARDTVGYSSNNANNSWVKPVTASINQTLAVIYGSQLANMVERFVETDESHPALTIDMIVPKQNSDPSVIYKGGDRVFIYVNQRPINYVKSELKELVTWIRDKYREAIGLSENNKKNPFIYMDIQLQPEEYDVNIEPNKTTIYFHNKQLICGLVKRMLNKAYPSTLDALFNKQAQSEINDKSDTIDLDQQEEPLFVTQPSSITETNVPPPPIQVADPPQRLSASPSANIDHSWSFSMLSDDEEEEPLEVTLSTEKAKSDKPTLINTTPMANWQIDTASSVIEPTTAPYKAADNTPKLMQSIPENDTSTSARSSSARPSRAAPVPKTIPTFVTPQKRAVSSGDDLSANCANKRISLPYITRQRDAPGSLEPSDIVVDLIAPSSRLSTTLPSSAQTPAKTVSVERLTPKPTFVSPSTGRSTTTKQQRLIPSTAQPTQNKAIRQLGLPEAFKRKAHIKNTPASTTVVSPSTSITSTLNQSLVIQCDIGEIKANYPNFKKQHDRTHLLSIADYLATHYEIPDIDTNAKLVSTTPTNNGLSFYSRGGIFELGVVKLRALGVNAIYNQLLKNHKVICKRKLNRPVQIQFRPDDSLCAALIGLDTKEVVVDDDLHGNKEIAYYEITDECIVNNGFNVRWRKDPSSHNLIFQFTGIYSLESAYGPSDFREILSLLDGSRPFVRPAKICAHLWSVAEEMYEQDKSPIELQVELQQLKWTRDTTSEDSNWELGLSESGHLLACRLSNATTFQP